VATDSAEAARGLLDIGEVVPRSDADDACLTEIRDVLRRHGALDRFGILLLHSHFSLDSDEILVEQVDVESRTQTIRPIGRTDAEGMSTVETQWILTTDSPVMTCVQYCQVTDNRGHLHQHVNADPPNRYIEVA
jgi:hypothetical protein